MAEPRTDDETLAAQARRRRVRLGRRLNLGLMALGAATTAGGAVLFAREVNDYYQAGWGWAVLAVGAFLLALSLTIAVFRPYLGGLRRMVLTTGVACLLLLTGIAGTWFLVDTNKSLDAVLGTPISEAAEANSYLDGQPGARGRLRIPTGVFVQSVKFTASNDVQVNGYLWQRLGSGVPESKWGVVLPEAGDSYAPKEVYREQTTDGGLVVGWYFNVTLVERFDYRRYPLDKQNLWLRMWSADMTYRSMLVPDYASYPPWHTDTLAGLDFDSVQGEWRPYYTTFSYQLHDYSASFGTQTYVRGDPGYPELYYNVGLARDFGGPMFSSLARSFIAALIVFCTLFLFTRDVQRRPLFGFSTWAVITFAVSMLLVIVVDQTAIRQATGARGMVYLEYITLALYLVIIGVATNAILLTSGIRVRFLEWRENLAPKLLYWPILLGLVFVFTLAVFVGTHA